jgi:uncharacterized protein YlxP (DUF503 family)
MSLSLKEKRSVLRPFITGLERLGSYSVSEIDFHDTWQRSVVGVAVVAPDGDGLAMQIEKIRRYLDSRPEVDVLDVTVSELEAPL